MAHDASIYDVAVVGLGLIGAATLRHASASGATCVGVGPAEPPDLQSHAGRFASHYDSGRITRVLDARLQRARLNRRAMDAYASLAEAAGLEFHRPVGAVLTAQHPGHFAAIRHVASALQVTHSVYHVGAVALDTRLHLPPTVGAIVEPSPAGHIDPRIMLRAQLKVAADNGAVIERNEIVAVRRHRGEWSMMTSTGERLRAHDVVVAAGAHLDELDGIDLRGVFDVYAETVVMTHLDAAEQARLDGLPALVSQVDDGVISDVYMVPPTLYPDGSVRLKLGASLQRALRLPDFESRHAWMSGRSHETELPRLRTILEATIPGLRATQWTTKPCLISDTPSGLPVIDTIDDGLVLAAGCNGSAAKSADAIGALAARLVVEGAWLDEELDSADFAFRVGGSGSPVDAADH